MRPRRAGLHGGFAPQLGGPAAGGGGISQNVSLGDLHANPWALPHPQLPLPLAVPGALEARFLELSSRLDHVVEMVSALAAQAQQLQQAQQLAAWHPAAGASEWGGAAPGGTPLVAHHHKPAEGDVTSVQKAYAARMDAIARSISSEAQSARDSVFWEAGPRGGAGGEGRAYGPYGGRPPAARLLSDGVAGGLVRVRSPCSLFFVSLRGARRWMPLGFSLSDALLCPMNAGGSGCCWRRGGNGRRCAEKVTPPSGRGWCCRRGPR